MKRVFFCLLLPLALGACNPFPKDDDESTPARGRSQGQPTPKATATPIPTPAPGAWMHDKHDNPLDHPAHK
jgi:hypothetical protein